MLPFKNRLNRKKDIEKVLKFGISKQAGNIVVKIKKNNLEDTRVGFLVGLKFSKKAVERNRCKRLLREVIKDKIKLIPRGWDILVMARKKENEKVSFHKLSENISQIFKEIFN